MRFIVIAAGDATRWGDYLGVPKHLIEIEGQRLIDRIVQLFLPYGEVFIVAPEGDPRYEVEGASMYYPRKNPANGGEDKFLNSRRLWSDTEQTVILYGDVWFSEAARDAIVEQRPGIVTFGREHGSSFTGSRWGELFAFSIAPNSHLWAEETLWLAVLEARAGRVARDPGGWEWYRALRNLPLDTHQIRGGFIDIDDWTEDFDHPEDYDNWVERRKKLK